MRRARCYHLPAVADADLELLAAWRGGNRRAGSALFDAYFPVLRRFFRNKVGDDYDELVQRTFARCVESQERFEGRGTFRSYLFAIACNVLREHVRQRGREHATLDAEEISVVELGLPGPATVAGMRREQALLLTALRRLPLGDQIVLELFYWEDLTSAEIASILEKPHGTIRSRLRLARERLRGQVDALVREGQPDAATSTDDLRRWAAELRRHWP